MSSSLFRSLTLNWLGLVVAGIVGLIVSPIVVHALGKELYGVWTLAVSLSSQLMILDFGIRNSLVAFVAKARARGDSRELSRLLSTATLLSVGAALASLIVAALVIPFAGAVFSIPPEFLHIFCIVLVICALDAAIELAFGVCNGALVGAERYDIMSAVNSLRLIGGAILIVVALELGWGVYGVAIVTLVARLIQRLVYAFYTRKVHRDATVSLRNVDQESAGRILRYGSWAFVMVVASRLINQADLIVLGVYLPPAALAVYGIPLILLEQFRLLAQSANSVLTPRLSSLEAVESKDTQQMLVGKWSALSSALAVAVGIPLIINGGDFITLWMGPGFEGAEPILQILTVPFLFSLPAMALINSLYATSRHSLGARIQILEAGANLTLSIVLVRYLGTLGVAIGTAAPAIVCTGILLPWGACRVLSLSFAAYLRQTLLRIVPYGIAYVVLLLGASSVFGVATWRGFILSHLLPVVCFGGMVLGGILDASDRAYLRRRLPAKRS